MRKNTTDLFGLSAKYIARVCRVDLATARRWKRGATCPPHAAILLLTGDLGIFDSAWAGWHIQGGKIVSPDGLEELPNSIRAIRFMQAQISTYQSENRRLRALLEECTFLDEQPLPDQWEFQVG